MVVSWSIRARNAADRVNFWENVPNIQESTFSFQKLLEKEARKNFVQNLIKLQENHS